MSLSFICLGVGEPGRILFFGLLLIGFWSELYYISIAEVDLFENIVRPSISIFNIAVYIVVIVYSYLAGVVYSNDIDYIYKQFSIFIAVIFILVSVIFSLYAYLAAKELNLVPIQLQGLLYKI